MIARLVLALLLAQSWVSAIERLWKKPDSQVSAALEKLRTGDAPKAVEILQKAAENLKEPHQQGALAYDTAAALLMVGPQGAIVAADEAKRAMESAATELHEPATYNLGFALAEQGKRDEAIDAYGKALQLEPGDRDASYNLELLLREQKQQQQGGGGEQKEDKPKSQDQKDQQEKQQQGAQGQPEQKKSEPKPEDNKQQEQKQQAQPKPDPEQQKKEEQQAKEQEAKGDKKRQKPEEEKKEQEARGRPVDRTQAQRLLDALRTSEKNLQVWRFGQRPKPQRQRNVEKDW